MDELTMSLSVFRGELKRELIIHREKELTQLIKHHINHQVLKPQAQSFLRDEVPRGNKLYEMPIIPKSFQESLGDWLIKIYKNNGDTFLRPLAVLGLFHNLGSIEYYLDPLTEKKLSKQDLEFLNKLDGVKLIRVKKIEVSKCKNIDTILKSSSTLEGAATTVTVAELKEINAIRDEIRKHRYKLVLFAFPDKVYEKYIHAAIRNIGMHMCRVTISQDGFGINYNHPYVRSMFLRPVTNFDFAGQDNNKIRAFLDNNKMDIVLCASGVDPAIIGYAEKIKVNIFNSILGPKMTIITWKHAKGKTIGIYASTFARSAFDPILDSAVDSVVCFRELMLMSIPVFPGLHPTITSRDLPDLSVKISESMPRNIHPSDGIRIFYRWEAKLGSTDQESPKCLILISPKGALKTTLTKRIVACLETTYPSADGLRFGRVDSDAFGRWYQARKRWTAWSEFDTFQDDDNNRSYFEVWIEGKLLEHNLVDERDITAPEMSLIKAEFSMEFIKVLNDKDWGMEQFFRHLFELVNKPEMLIIESHTATEIGKMPQTRDILNLYAPYNVYNGLRSRCIWKGVPMLPQLCLLSFYKELMRDSMYDGIYSSDVLHHLNYSPILT